jgi:pseudaminic acid biosynthesis-associated methylase
MNTAQTLRWTNQFGRDYTDRNSLTLSELDALYQRNYGVTRRELNERFLAEVPRSARVLEVGCNIGNQLRMLRELGFSNLYGIEIQHYALQQAKSRVRGINVVEASALEIPFCDGSFDLVFTSGVLIHIAPENLSSVLGEIHRCTSKYIWGFEYHSSVPTEVSYRGNRSLLWKMNYPQAFLDQFHDLELLRAEQLSYLDNSNIDCMFLVCKVPTVPAK